MIDSTINTADFDKDKIRKEMLDFIDNNRKSPNCYDQQKIMVYENIEHIKGGKQVNIKEVIQDIRSKSERIAIKNKKLLPVAYFSVEDFNGNKEDRNVKKHTGLIVIDIDKKDNPDTNFVDLRRRLEYDKYTYACFSSPSGGIKLVVNTNISSKEHHLAYYEGIRKHFLYYYPEIKKIDTSGSNIARACYMPFDSNAYFNPNAYRFCFNTDQIVKILAYIRVKHSSKKSLEPLVQIESISFDDHYKNILNLIKKRTSMGLPQDNSNNEKRTNMGLYDNIFNNYRYYNISAGVMSTDVPYLELIIWKNIYPSRLDWITRLDEYYFKDNPQKLISTDSIEGLDGLEICEVVLPKNHVIKEFFRAKTLGSISMKLIFNNPFCHPDYIIKEVNRINDYYCEDPYPNNPKPDTEEVRKIVMTNYAKFINGDLDFSTVIRKKNKKDEVSKKYVFRSKQYLSIDRSIVHLEAVRTFHEGRHGKNIRKFEEAICVLQDGKKITQKRIAEYMGMSTRNLRRYATQKYDELIDNYNATIKSCKAANDQKK
jgi:VirE N-terminal domain